MILLAPEQAPLLGEAFRRAGYDEAGVGRSLDGAASLRLKPEDLPFFRAVLEAEDDLAALIRLFLFPDSVPVAAAAAALAPADPDALVSIGLLEPGGDGDGSVSSPFLVTPTGDLLVVHDPWPLQWEHSPPDAVFGAGPASHTLAALTVRRRVRTALDVGTGTGIQAMLAARHSEKVTATDINPRALAIARFNCAMNGLDNVEVVEGSLFEPAAGRAFDLVVSNPPFVISPDTALVFRDAGTAGDLLSGRVVEQAAAHLADGGFATVVCDWVVEAGANWSERARSWIDGSGCDAWLLRHGIIPSLVYAASWNRGPDVAAAAEAIARWAGYYERSGIDRICSGVVVSHRPDGRGRADPLIVAEDRPGRRRGECGRQIEAILESSEAVRGLARDEVLSRAFRLRGGIELETLREVGIDGVESEKCVLRWAGGLRLATALDAFESEVVDALDGHTSLGEIAAASDSGRAAAAADRAEALVGRLAARGYVIPA